MSTFFKCRNNTSCRNTKICTQYQSFGDDIPHRLYSTRGKRKNCIARWSKEKSPNQLVRRGRTSSGNCRRRCCFQSWKTRGKLRSLEQRTGNVRSRSFRKFWIKQKLLQSIHHDALVIIFIISVTYHQVHNKRWRIHIDILLFFPWPWRVKSITWQILLVSGQHIGALLSQLRRWHPKTFINLSRYDFKRAGIS